MSTLTVRNLSETVEPKLRVRAAQEGVSMEEEARSILTAAVLKAQPPESGLGLSSRIRALFANVGGVELQIPPRR
jgi:antitoxin FitA